MFQHESFDELKPLDDLETHLVRAALERPGLISEAHEAGLRQAISVSRLQRLEDRRATHLLDEHTRRLRDEVTTLLVPQLGPGKTPSPQSLAAVAPLLQGRARKVRHEILQARGDALDPADLDREIEQKSLVLVCGGGGGTGYVHLGAFGLLEELALRPKLILGTSMGAVMGIFRSRKEAFDPGEMVSVLRSISYRKIFRFFATDSRYGLPAALRLYLRAALGRHFTNEDGAPLRLSQMRVPIIISASGIRRGKLPHPPEYYERLLSLSGWSFLSPNKLRLRITEAVRAISEIAQLPDLVELHFGATPETHQFDALDAVGFSCALPGVVHYDVLRDDVRMHQMLAALLETYDISRLIDGGLTANVPSRQAWRSLHGGRIGTRNGFILALDPFAPKLHTPLWLPLQQIAHRNVVHDAPWAHHTHAFKRTLSPLELVPTVDNMLKIAASARDELLPQAPFLRRMLAPLPSLEAVHPDPAVPLTP